MEKKNIVWIISIILFILALVFGIKSCVSNKDHAKLDKENQELKKSLEKQTAAANFYAAQLDTCKNNIQKPLTVEERLANAEAELAALKNQPAPAPAIRYIPAKQKIAFRKAPVKKNDVAETQFTQTSFAMPAARSEVVVSNNNSVSSTAYEGEIKGDVGLTINPARRLIYFIKSTVLTGNEFYVNGDNGKKMTLNKKSGYWYYIDSRVLSDWEIANSVITWNVKEGMVNWGGGSYQAWFPHESLKSLINSVRGFEYGMITNDDLNQMSQKDSHIWSPKNHGGIYQPLPGVNKERTDPNFWHGWNIRSKISYKKVTK